jgi:hypothetical protein
MDRSRRLQAGCFGQALALLVFAVGTPAVVHAQAPTEPKRPAFYISEV